MSFKSERRNNKKGNRKFTPVGANSAQAKKAEINKDFHGSRVNCRIQSKKNDHGRSSFILNAENAENDMYFNLIMEYNYY